MIGNVQVARSTSMQLHSFSYDIHTHVHYTNTYMHMYTCYMCMSRIRTCSAQDDISHFRDGTCTENISHGRLRNRATMRINAIVSS
jgi:hypothetical protein